MTSEATKNKSSREVPKRLRRYTDLPSVLGVLCTKELTLLDPARWTDRNDSSYLETYRRSKGFSTVLATCFTTVGETFHHWQVFGGGPAGVCVMFKGPELVKAMAAVKGIRQGWVRYARLADVRESGVGIEEMPFVKRIGYGDEREYRFIYEAKGRRALAKSVAIELDWIESVHLSPWLHQSLDAGVRRALRQACEGHKLVINRSTLLDNKTWKEAGGASIG